jgi:hypothetical protein
MQTITAAEADVQASSVSDVHTNHKCGVEIVRSAPIGSRNYRGSRHTHSPISKQELSPRDRMIALRGQLTLLRKRLQAGLPVTADCVLRAERLAISLETEIAA